MSRFLDYFAALITIHYRIVKIFQDGFRWYDFKTEDAYSTVDPQWNYSLTEK